MIARTVEHNLEEILDRTMDAFAAEIPNVAAAPEAIRRRVREGTRRAMLAFIALYADPDSPARTVLSEARRVTIDRAGEDFEREDIVAMLHVARIVVYRSTRDFVAASKGSDPATDAEIEAALVAFLDELERTEQALPQTDDAVHHLLVAAEGEEPDLA
jgi:hypothetical protein